MITVDAQGSDVDAHRRAVDEADRLPTCHQPAAQTTRDDGEHRVVDGPAGRLPDSPNLLEGHGHRGEAALQAYQAQRRAHVAVYQRWSRWLTPLFQSNGDLWAHARDVLLGPMGRMPGGRGHMLRVLSGTQHGWFGALPLDPGFIAALAEAPRAAASSSAIAAAVNVPVT